MSTLVVHIGKLHSGAQPGYPLKLSLHGPGELSAPPQQELLSVIPESEGKKLQAARSTLLDTSGMTSQLEEIGRELFGLLNHGEVGAKLLDLRQSIRQDPTATFHALLCIEDPELRALPWELLYCPETHQHTFLDSRCTIMRGPPHLPSSPGPLDWPLRVLVVVACAPDAPIDWRKELQAMEQAFRKQRNWIEYDVLLHPGQAKLKAEYARLRPHILHIIGHGMTDESGDAYLQFWDASLSSDNVWRWTGPQATLDLRNSGVAEAPRLVFLNTCRSNLLAAQRGVFSMADAFLQAGARAVLGMQADIPGGSAAHFAACFYQNLSEQRPLAVAVALARYEVATLSDVGTQRRDWALPCLLLNTRPELLLPASSAVPEEEQARIAMADELKVVRDFVDRRRERRELVSVLEQSPPERPRKGMIITGESEVGKTALVLLCLQGCALRGRKFHYVNLRGVDTLDFLSFLRTIRDGRYYTPGPPSSPDPGAEETPFCRPLPTEPFRRFNWELNELLEGREPAAEVPVGPVPDRGLPLQPGHERLVERIFTSFRTALNAAAQALAGSGPLFLVLDHLENVLLPHFTKYTLPLFIKKLLADGAGAVRLILIVRKQSSESLQLAALQSVVTPLEVRYFARDDFAMLAQEFGGFDPEFDIATPNLIKKLPPLVPPLQLQRLLGGFKELFQKAGGS